uniref:Uncharacterized protein LOC104227048 isoform X1 n=1 Tax=Nicotiana sylvestris TaxID=4096 RepID=A0A1U7WJN6_NICSY|nr:PREDICTED: uncharacterized protein LOC104227048 isoform X1 [Nicotiana sylvestris]XP_009777482.1 PREDICTED: uncharacterized protein LOC104227048 isoform X1 [Nicotiana sylvestris]
MTILHIISFMTKLSKEHPCKSSATPKYNNFSVLFCPFTNVHFVAFFIRLAVLTSIFFLFGQIGDEIKSGLLLTSSSERRKYQLFFDKDMLLCSVIMDSTYFDSNIFYFFKLILVLQLRFLGAFAMLSLSFGHNLQLASSLLWMIGGSVAQAIADVTIDACVTENSISHLSLASDMQSLCGVSSSIGQLICFPHSVEMICRDNSSPDEIYS